MRSVPTPQAVVIAGPNGAGKTSSAPDLLHDTVGIDAFINADVIAQGLAGFSPGSVAFEAGRIVLRRLSELVRAREDFAFESTLAGRTAKQLLSRALRTGYHLHIFYLWLPSPEMAVARVRRRVAAGGHDVPEPVIRRRFWKSLVNFDRLYRPLATTWRLYDASALDARPLVAHGTATGDSVVLDQRRWKQIRDRTEDAS